VGVYYRTDDPDAAENVRVDIMIDNAHSTDIKTDKDGRWTFDKMPAEIDKNELRIFLTHPDYMSDNLRPSHIPLPITRQPSIEKLRDLSAVMVMKEGLKVSGKVTDKQGNPIARAKIYDTEGYWWRSTKPVVETDAQGQFLSNANPGTTTWTVQAPGYAPDLRVVMIKAGMRPVEFRLEPGRTIEGKVTDQAGKPIEGAGISAEEWRKHRRRLHLVAKTDTEGNFKVTDAPADEVTFDIGKEGYMMLEKYPMKSGKEKYNITLRPTLKVRGTVLDAQTGLPIKKFTVTNGFDHEDGRAPQWDKHSVRSFTDGQYEMEYRQEIFTYRIRIDAEGYQSALSGRIRPEEISESNMVCHFKLNKAAAATGTVLAPDGTPLSGAEVVVATHWLQISKGKVNSRSSEENRILHTGANGRFRFEPPVSPYAIVVLCEQGYARIEPQEFKASQTITLSPWGRIEGTLRIGTQPGADRLVAFLHESRSHMEQPRIYYEYETQTDKNGRFAFTRVFPGKGVVTRAIPMGTRGRRFSHSVDVEVKSGQTARVQIGGTGRPVIGKVVVPDMIKDTFDWQHTEHSLRVSSPDSSYRILALDLRKDGSFRTDDVPAGDYTISVIAFGPPPNQQTYRGERIGILSRAFTIPEIPGGRTNEPFDLGRLELEVIGKSALTPSLIGKPLPDLSRLKIEPATLQADAKMILICFWDLDQRPSRRCLSRLAEQATELRDEDVTIVAVQASKVNHGALNRWVTKNSIPFPVGMIQDNEETTRFKWGVKWLPWLLLTDKEHIVRAEGFGLGELEAKIRENENVQE
ncbi:MAG: carboxypeptidase regulatory-like domain-containing protein, partial [Phycisphaerales bacterium]